MNDMISRSALLEEWNKLSARGRTEFDQVIMMQPSVEPVRGELIDGTDGCKHCSKCGAVADETMMQWNNLYFCYHCGADMRKKVAE